MTLQYMEGFETSRDDSDVRLHGWSVNPSKATTRNVVPIPSVTGISGYSLRPQGPFSSPLSSTVPGAAAANDFGYFNTGITVNQAWTAGGITLGWYGRFNSGNPSTSLSSGALASASASTWQSCFDGTKYWAIQYNGSVYQVASSTDLRTWTVASAQPAIVNAYTTISYVGNNTIAVVAYANSTSTALNVYYTTNGGTSWTTQTLANATASTSGCGGCIVATGNTTYPHAILIVCFTNSGASNQGGVFVGTLGGTFTQVTTVGSNSAQCYNGGRLIGGLIVFPMQTGLNTIYSATASNASLNTSGAWSTATLSSALTVTDIAYNPTSNLWVVSSFSGIHTFANSGSAGTPVAPTGTVTVTQRYSTVGMSRVWWTGTQLVAHGAQGHIITSLDGITWTETGGHILAQGTAAYDWRCSLYDGTQYVLFSDQVTGIIATTPDLVTNYQAQYAAEYAESTQAIGATVVGTGLFAGTAPAANGTFTLLSVSGGGCNMLQIGPASGGTRPVTLDNWNGGALYNTTASTSTGHYFELKNTKNAGTVNTFTTSLYVDGVLLYTSAAFPMAATSDTTSLFIASFQRNGVFTALDDIYITLDDGSGLTGPLGPINIVASRPNADVSAQWVRNGGAASNAAAASTAASASGAVGSSSYVSSSVAGDKDVYSSPNVIPANYTVKAVQVEGVFTRTSSSVPQVNIGVKSGTAEADGSTTSLTTGNATIVQSVFLLNPNGNVAWTATAAAAAQPVLNHIV